MTRLFAALDGHGRMQFVGEVSRGRACGCHCPECGSPLVAKQGDDREWHFAHESGQERPECEAGALNMLRRLAIEHLKRLPSISLPRYVQRVQVQGPVRAYFEDVSWMSQPTEPPNWAQRPSKHEPVATLRLDNGIDVDLLVEFADSLPSTYPSTPETASAVAFWCTVPVNADLRKRIYAEQHVRHWGRFVWRHQRDIFGLVEATHQRLRARVEEDEKTLAQARRRAAEAAAERWAEKARMLDAARGYRAAASPSEASPITRADAGYDWAPDRKAGSAFMFYRLLDGSAWVIYTLTDERFGIAPYPVAEDGWDEALPASVGRPDDRRLIYLANSLPSALAFFGARHKALRVTTDPGDFEGVRTVPPAHGRVV